MTVITLDEIRNLPIDTYVYVDTRGRIAYEHGHIPDALCWSRGEDPDVLPRDKKLILYCSVGLNSVGDARDLKAAGCDACSLQNGYRA